MTHTRTLYVIVCGAGPATHLTDMVALAQADGWDTHIIATPAGSEFLDLPALTAQTGHPVRTHYRQPDQPRQQRPPADALIIAPATYNSINKLAAGITDTYALGIAAELIGKGVPVIVLPFINTALAARKPLQTAVANLRAEGVHILIGEGGYEPHAPGEGGARIATFPWLLALAAAKRSADR